MTCNRTSSKGAPVPDPGPDLDSTIREWYPRIFNHLLRKSGSWDVAEEVTQDTFVRVVSSWKGVRPDGNVGCWIVVISNNALMNYYRSKQYRTRTRCVELTEVEWIPSNEDVEDLVIRSVIMELVLDQVPPKNRIEMLGEHSTGVSQTQRTRKNRGQKMALKIMERMGVTV